MPKDYRHYEYDEFWGDAPRRTRLRKKKRKKSSYILPALAVLLVAFFAFAYVGYQLAGNILGDVINPSGDSDKTKKDGVPQEEKRPAGILLIGVDQRANEPSRADTIMVAFIDDKDSRISVLSIPRDTYVAIPGRTNKEKIGHAHAYGGPSLLAETVEEFLDIDVTRYVEVNFQGFASVIDTLGGVEIEVEKRMEYALEGIDLYPGLQRLDGNKALQYVRYRHDGDDTTRIKRQQKFLTALADQALSISTVWKLPELIKAVQAQVRTDLSIKESLALAKVFKDAGAAKVETATLPGSPEYIKGISYWVPSDEKTKEIVNKMAAN